MINSARVRDLNNQCFGNSEEVVHKVSRAQEWPPTRVQEWMECRWEEHQRNLKPN